MLAGRCPAAPTSLLRRLAHAGGPPPTWQIYPHASGDGKALHLVRAEAADAITAHLGQFADIYAATEPVEVVDEQMREYRSSHLI